MEGWSAPLLDPNPCVYADGTLESEDLGWRLSTGSTCTVRLEAQWRMYFAIGRLDHFNDGESRREYPVHDAGGREKFATHEEGPIGPPDRIMAWWKATPADTDAPEVEELHFSPDFISFLDSPDGVEFPLYAPRVEPVSGTSCDEVDYHTAGPVHEDAVDGFRSGWRSTVIPSQGQERIYRDPSVVYIEAARRYLMFVVECDGSHLDRDPSDFGVRCDICTPEGLARCGVAPPDDLPRWIPTPTQPTPVTRLVFFTCPDPDFQQDVIGPIPATPTAPRWRFGQWIGVPQAFLSLDSRVVFWHASGPGGWQYQGLHAASTSDFAQAIEQVEAQALAGVPPDTLGGLAYEAFTNFGSIFLQGDTPGTCNPPMVADEHFVFCSDGRLHLYVTNRSDPTGSTGEDLCPDSGGPVSTQPPLDLVSHAFASTPLDVDELLSKIAVNPLLSDDCFEDAVAEFYRSGRAAAVRASGGQSAVDSYINLLRTTTRDCSDKNLREMLTLFILGACNPINMQSYLGAETVSRPVPFADAECIPVECNDPDAYLAADGRMVLHLHSAALGGLFRMTAPARRACNTRPTRC